jgi:LacI family transcriptional regulator
MAKTVLFFESAFCQTNQAQQDGARRYARAAGWQLRTIEYGRAARDRAGKSGVKGRDDIRKLVAFWKADGCIVECGNEPTTFMAADFSPLPTVFLDRHPDTIEPGTVCVSSDVEAVASSAAQVLLELGFGDYAYVGWLEPVMWSEEREARFAEIVRLNGKAFHSFPKPARRISDRRLHTQLVAWLAHLPRPCGICAANDYVARIVLDACVQLRIAVPAEMAVVGVDNEDRICENTRPTLTSVLPDNDRAGYIAAELLDGLMKGDRPKSRMFGVLTVVRRQSTCRYRRSDARVLAAVETIRRQACEGLSAKAVIDGMGCSRRLAEMRFREVTGHSILDEITDVRLANARMMLRDPRKTVEMVAASCGYNSTVALRKAFLSHLGEPLSAWRERQHGV